MSKTFSAKLVIMFVFIIAMIKALSMSAHASVTTIDPLRYLDYYPDSLCREFEFHVGNKGVNNAGVNGFQWSTSDNFFVAYYNNDTITVYSVSRFAVTPALAIIRNQADDSIFHIGKSSPLSTGSFNYNDVTTIYYGAFATYSVSDTAYYNIPTISGSSFTSALTQYLNGYFYRCKNESVFYTMIEGGASGGSTDLATIEQYLETIDNNIGTSKIDISDIKTDVNYIRQNGTSGSGITQDIKDLMVRYDTWLTLIFFAVGLSLFRVVLRSVGDKFSRMR